MNNFACFTEKTQMNTVLLQLIIYYQDQKNPSPTVFSSHSKEKTLLHTLKVVTTFICPKIHAKS